MARSQSTFLAAAAWVMFVAIGPAAAQMPAPVAPPILDVAAQAEFLRTAKVVRSRTISRGVTAPQRLTLSDGTVTHDAAFQSVDEQRTQADFGAKGVEFNFKDSHHFNLAAYQIAGMLGLDGMMPVTVHRNWNGKDGHDHLVDRRRLRRVDPAEGEAAAAQSARLELSDVPDAGLRRAGRRLRSQPRQRPHHQATGSCG